MLIFQKRLKEIRKERGYNQETVGRSVCVSKQEICLYEKGKRTPPLEILIKLASFLEVDFTWLLGMEITVTKKNNKVVNLSEEDLKIIEEIKNNHSLYEKILNNPTKTILALSRKIKDIP